MALRCFIAVEIADALKDAIGNVIEALRKSGADVRWVSHRNIHITLKFLGSTDKELTEKITASLKNKLLTYPRFYIRISGAGCFPDRRRPRVIWIGISDPGELKGIQKDVDDVMKEFGFPPEERPFLPHITIGRARSQKGAMEMLKVLDGFSKTDFGEIEIKGVTLMKSELKPGGAEYRSLAEIAFEGRKNVN